MPGTILCMYTYYIGTHNNTMVRYYCYHSHFTKKEVSGSGRLNNEFKFSQLVSDSLAQTQVYMAPKPNPTTTHYVTHLYNISEENSSHNLRHEDISIHRGSCFQGTRTADFYKLGLSNALEECERSVCSIFISKKDRLTSTAKVETFQR